MNEDYEDHIKRLEDRVKRLEELVLPKIKPKKEPKFLHIDPKAVRASLRERGWNQSDLARAMRIGKDLISNWLSGKNNPTKEHWDLLRKFVDIV